MSCLGNPTPGPPPTPTTLDKKIQAKLDRHHADRRAKHELLYFAKDLFEQLSSGGVFSSHFNANARVATLMTNWRTTVMIKATQTDRGLFLSAPSRRSNTLHTNREAVEQTVTNSVLEFCKSRNIERIK